MRGEVGRDGAEVFATSGTRLKVRIWELPKDVPANIQERAYTTPIWYTP